MTEHLRVMPEIREVAAVAASDRPLAQAWDIRSKYVRAKEDWYSRALKEPDDKLRRRYVQCAMFNARMARLWTEEMNLIRGAV